MPYINGGHLGCHIRSVKAIDDKLSDLGLLKGAGDTKLPFLLLAARKHIYAKYALFHF